MITLWKSLVQHIPDYCSQLWAPSTLGQILSLEMVLRSYLRKVSGLQHLSYVEQLKELKMYSIQRRHERYAIIYMWRILEGQVPDFTHGKLKHTANLSPKREIFHYPSSQSITTQINPEHSIRKSCHQRS